MGDFNFLDTKIEFLKGVGPNRAEALKKELKIFSFYDLLNYIPFRYVDRTKFYKINSLNADLPYVQIIARFVSTDLIGVGNSQRFVAKIKDDTGLLELVWFKGVKWIKDKFKPNIDYVIFGKPALFNGKINISHPEVEELELFKQSMPSALQSVYNSGEKLKNMGLDSRGISKLLRTLIPQLTSSIIEETLSRSILDSMDFMGKLETYRQLHFPSGAHALIKARNRMKFEELFYIQLDLLKLKKERDENQVGFIFSKIGNAFNTFFETKLPFKLTEAQKRVIREIRTDFGRGKQMNRLLQGDVGSGKTMVALMTMLIAIDNGFQTCLMAPTEILASQHYDTFVKMLEGIDIHVKILTGSTKSVERKKILAELNDGTIHLIIGTHALLEDKVVFKNLGYVVIDEQHKFGVAQRAKLWSKNTNPPHILVMTATPIPRTLAMTVYGDLDVSIIDELPPGRKPVMTLHKMDNERYKLIHFMKEQIKLGRQIYIVYPLINESETLDLKDLGMGYEELLKHFPLPEYGVSILHGQMKSADKEAEMQLFLKGKTNIMVATTVIEVGVNIPNASVMIIENAERFGLSQLHQLRGRVGRGAEQSYCILMSKDKLSYDAKKRMAVMVGTNDGFKIAEADMNLRGPGDITGTQQSGMLPLTIADLRKDYQILASARQIAGEIIDKDPLLSMGEHSVLRNNLLKYRRKKEDWSKIS